MRSALISSSLYFMQQVGGVMTSHRNLDLSAVLDGLSQGVLIFSSDGRLAHENLAARTILGKDLALIQKSGWEAASALFNARQADPEKLIEAVSERALQSDSPEHFYTFLNGEYIPCWAAAIQQESGEIFLMITLDLPDWSAITTLLDRFRSEMREAIMSTQGHIDIINQTIAHVDPEDDAAALSKRITGFTRLIAIHMDRVARLMEMLERLEAIRTGTIREETRNRRRRIDLTDFMEDFEEELDEISLIDLETEAGDHRSRLEVNIINEVYAAASPAHLTRILHDILRNAIMYSMKATPIKITVQAKNRSVQIDIADQGYGVRTSERERVFEAFARALQPQIIGEFGYGLSLYLCKHEVEAMNGRMWFESQENIGTTFSVMLPTWQDDSASSATNQT